MNESEERLSTAAARKEKIRERYRGINPDELDVIPALPQSSSSRLLISVSYPRITSLGIGCDLYFLPPT